METSIWWTIQYTNIHIQSPFTDIFIIEYLGTRLSSYPWTLLYSPLYVLYNQIGVQWRQPLMLIHRTLPKRTDVCFVCTFGRTDSKWSKRCAMNEKSQLNEMNKQGRSNPRISGNNNKHAHICIYTNASTCAHTTTYVYI